MPGYLEKQLDTLTRLVNKKPPDSVVINGDIFHRRNPKGEELLAFRRLLEGLHTRNIYINRGNHDTVKKDGSSDTTLSVNFDFIPHYEDESRIIADIKRTCGHIFGHFGFQGCVSNGSYEYESAVKRSHFGKKRLVFLGHIHKPMTYGKNVFVLGTQYSTNFGESNTQKYIHELIIRDGNVEVIRKPINFGIRHVATSLAGLETAAQEYNFDGFFTILRLKMDTLDEGSEKELMDALLNILIMILFLL